MEAYRKRRRGSCLFGERSNEKTVGRICHHPARCMNHFTVLCLILGMVFFISCSREKNGLEPKRTVIAGVVKNFSDEASALVVNYCNPLSDERRFAQNLIESNGYFQTEHEYVFAQDISIRFGNRFIMLFVHPGDSIFITIDANEMRHNFDNAVTFSGDRPELNREMFLWTNYAPRKLFQNIPEFDSHVSPEDFLASIKQEFDKGREFIKAYSERTDMSDFLKRWAYLEIKFVIANYASEYSHPEANMWDIFTSPIFDVFDENNFQTMYFDCHLSVCMNALIQSEVEISRLISEKKYIPAIRLTIEKLFEKAPKGVVRDMMLFWFLKGTISKLPNLYDSVPEIKTVFSQDFFNKELKKLSEKNKTVRKLSEEESVSNGLWYMSDGNPEKLPEVKILNFLAEKHHGKVLYIDVWATWCGLCFNEFKTAPALHKYFKDKDVVFVNLCLSSTSVENWNHSIMTHNIDGENYFLDDNASQLFMGENNLKGFPSYLIIDKNKEVHDSAPRPSHLESAIQKITSLL
jgi:thiol-disulfide isomerase/thioredoxin